MHGAHAWAGLPVSVSVAPLRRRRRAVDKLREVQSRRKVMLSACPDSRPLSHPKKQYYLTYHTPYQQPRLHLLSTTLTVLASCGSSLDLLAGHARSHVVSCGHVSTWLGLKPRRALFVRTGRWLSSSPLAPDAGPRSLIRRNLHSGIFVHPCPTSTEIV